jgi:hypothetical protein
MMLTMTTSSPHKFFHNISMAFKCLDWDGGARDFCTMRPHFQSIATTLGQTEKAMTKRKVTCPPDGVRGMDGGVRFID